MHLYNSTSTTQRRVVFGLDRAGIKAIAVAGARVIGNCAAAQPATDWIFQYSPESFTGTELDFAVEICEAVMDVWRPTPQHKMIVNLPGTVEMPRRTSTPTRSNGCRGISRAATPSCCRCIRTMTAAVELRQRNLG